MFYYLKNKIKTLQDKMFLKRHGCKTWEQYNYIYDPDINLSAIQVGDYYHGYKSIKCIDNPQHIAYHCEIAFSGISVLSQWCDNNCVDKYRFDFLRVRRVGNSTDEKEEWHINGIGDVDYIFVAFKNPMDCTMFTLTWG